jgi:glycerol uptake facilitator-like aquaporin
MRRAGVECVGTLLLMLVVTSAGFAAQRLNSEMAHLGIFYSALATGGALIGLVIAFGNASGGHFNPLITCLQWIAHERKTSCTIAYVVAQFVGGLLGALAADVLFQARIKAAEPAHIGATMLLSEVISTAGLMVVIFGCSRSGLKTTGPLAAGSWLIAAIVAVPSGSYANPAISLAAIVAGGRVALPLYTALSYVPVECAGALIALAIISLAYPRTRLSKPRSPPRDVAGREETENEILKSGLEPGASQNLIAVANVRPRAEAVIRREMAERGSYSSGHRTESLANGRRPTRHISRTMATTLIAGMDSIAGDEPGPGLQ